MMVEMEEMASRPFASVTVEIDRKLDLAEKKETNSVDLRKRKKVNKSVFTLMYIGPEFF